MSGQGLLPNATLERAAWEARLGPLVWRSLGDRESRPPCPARPQPCGAGHSEARVGSTGRVPSWGQASRLHLLTAPKLGDWELCGGGGCSLVSGAGRKGSCGSPESTCAPSQVPTFPLPGVGGTQGPWSRGGSTGAAEIASPLTPLPALRAPLPWSPGTVGAAVRTGPLNTCTYRGDAACGGVTITAGCWGGHTGCPSLPEPPPPPGCRR